MRPAHSQLQDSLTPIKTLPGAAVAAWLLALTLLGLPSASDVATAQGLSGPSQRLEETVGQQGGQEEDQGGYDSEMEEQMSQMSMEEAMMMGSGDPSGYGGPSYGSRSSGTPQSDAVLTYASGLSSLLEEMDLSPLFDSSQDIAVQTGPVLQREAEQAFQSGDHGLALELMFGHMATEYSDAIEEMQSVQYSKLLRRPVWNVRWGVSMAVRGGDEVADPQPIRQGATPGGQSYASQGEGDFEQFGADMEQQQQQEMEAYEQEMQMEMEMEMEMQQGISGMSPRRPTQPTAPAMPVREMLGEEAGETLDTTLGLVATVVADEFNKRFQEGDFGPLFIAMQPPAPADSARGGTRSSAGAAAVQTPISQELNDALSDSQPIEMWQPGIVYLGQGILDEIVPQARAANLDLVLHFDVVLKPGRTGVVQNISRCRMIDVATGKSKGVSKGMDSFEARRMVEARGKDERSYVEEQLSNLLAIVDRDAKVIDLPDTLRPEDARFRIKKMISGPRARTLRTLAEVRMYQLRGLIDEDEVEAIFDIVGGADGLMLLHGPLEERMKMARKWAVASQLAAVQP